jgi:hypothetical protein
VVLQRLDRGLVLVTLFNYLVMKNAYINENGEIVHIDNVWEFNVSQGVHVFCECGLAIPYQQVLKSAAGYYIGTVKYDEEIAMWMPNSRDSIRYYDTISEAIEALEKHQYMYV